MSLLPRRLNARIILIVSCVLLATGVASGWLSARNQTASLLAAMRANSTIMARNFSESCARYLLVQDYAELETYLLKSAELNDIRRLQVCEPGGALVWDIEHDPGEHPHAKSGIARLTPPVSGTTTITTENDLLTIWHPIEAGNMLGWLKADFSLSAIREAQTRTWENALLLAMAWVACSAFLIVLVLRPIVRSIARLTAFSKRLDEQKGAQISVTGQPLEIAELGESLNEASARLLATERQIFNERERLHASEQLFRTLAENSPDVIVRYDREGRRIYVNPEFERVNRLTAEQVLGKKPLEISTELAPMAEVFTKKLMAAMESGTVTKIDLSWTKEGKLLCWFVRVVPEFDADGCVASALTIWSDISERKQIEEEMRQLNEELEERVKGRTSELEEKNSELARLNRIFVGRELRMIELKERIRELENNSEKTGDQNARQ
ncbi:MAG: PAS domain S-box protein [Pelobacteraceae bacterium]